MKKNAWLHRGFLNRGFFSLSIWCVFLVSNRIGFPIQIDRFFFNFDCFLRTFDKLTNHWLVVSGRAGAGARNTPGVGPEGEGSRHRIILLQRNQLSFLIILCSLCLHDKEDLLFIDC